VKLTAREAARLLAVTETEVYRWVDSGTIPFYMVNHQPRFARTELLEWATSRRLAVSPEMFQSEDDGEGRLGPTLAEALERGGIHAGIAGASREVVLRAAVDRLPFLDEADRALLGELLVARQSAGATAIGEGIAIPHVRSPVVCPGGAGAITLCYLEQPLDFQATDGQPIHTLFLILSPAIATHLQLLSKLSLALLDPGFRALVARRAPAPEILADARRVESRFTPPAAGAAPREERS
jgi:nitrogen PTS system EIIA component